MRAGLRMDRGTRAHVRASGRQRSKAEGALGLAVPCNVVPGAEDRLSASMESKHPP